MTDSFGDKNVLVPALRFPKFISNWTVCKLADVGNKSRGAVKAGPFGSALKKEYYVESGYKIYGQEQVISSDPYKGDYYIDEDKYNSLKSCAVIPGDILVSLVGTIGKVLVIPDDAEKGIINPRLIRISLDNQKVIPKYIAYFLGKSEIVYKLESWSQGGTMGVLNASLFKMLPISLPKIEEQQRIADFLSSVDKKISLLKKRYALITQYKKGVMQKLFTQEIRFKDDNGNNFPDWQEFPLSEVATPIKRKATEAVENVMTISAGKGFLSQKERFSQIIAGTSLDKYTHLKQGEFSYNRGNSKSYTYGCIYKLDKEQALVPYVYRSFSLNKGDADFFSHLFQFKYLDRQLRRLISSSARMDGLLNIGEKDFYQVRVPFPCEDEQKKIAEFLDALDTKLDAVNQQIGLMQTFKKGLLQQMFV